MIMQSGNFGASRCLAAGRFVTERVALALRADLAELASAQVALEAFCAHHGLAPATEHKLALIIEELLSNAIRHGMGESGAEGVEVGLERQGVRVLGRVVDRGPPFDPTAAVAPDVTSGIEARQVGGLGVHLVRSLVEGWSYTRKGGRNRLEFSLLV